LAHDRITLQNTKKRVDGIVKEYAQRWQWIVVQVNPLLSENKIISIFINTFKALYFECIICNTLKQFLDIVVVFERVERALRERKMIWGHDKELLKRMPLEQIYELIAFDEMT
jgi:hypothetical protein